MKTRKIKTIKKSIKTKQKLDMARYQSTISYTNATTITTWEEETTWGVHPGWWRTYDNGVLRALICNRKQREFQKSLYSIITHAKIISIFLVVSYPFLIFFAKSDVVWSRYFCIAHTYDGRVPFMPVASPLNHLLTRLQYFLTSSPLFMANSLSFLFFEHSRRLDRTQFKNRWRVVSFDFVAETSVSRTARTHLRV